MDIDCGIRHNRRRKTLAIVDYHEDSFELKVTDYSTRVHVGIRYEDRMVFSEIVNERDILEDTDSPEDKAEAFFEYGLESFGEWDLKPENSEILYFGPKELSDIEYSK